jgi:hypothetical protein
MDPQKPTQPGADTEARPAATPSLMNLQIIWGAILASTVIYVFVAYAVGGQSSALDAEQTRIFELVCAAVALSGLGASFVLPRRMLTAALAKEPVEVGQDTPLPRLVRAAFPAWVVRMALCEMVATMGLMLALVTHKPVKIMPFAALAMLALLAAFPSEPALRRATER